MRKSLVLLVGFFLVLIVLGAAADFEVTVVSNKTTYAPAEQGSMGIYIKNNGPEAIESIDLSVETQSASLSMEPVKRTVSALGVGETYSVEGLPFSVAGAPVDSLQKAYFSVAAKGRVGSKILAKNVEVFILVEPAGAGDTNQALLSDILRNAERLLEELNSASASAYSLEQRTKEIGLDLSADIAPLLSLIDSTLARLQGAENKPEAEFVAIVAESEKNNARIAIWLVEIRKKLSDAEQALAGQTTDSAPTPIPPQQPSGLAVLAVRPDLVAGVLFAIGLVAAVMFVAGRRKPKIRRRASSLADLKYF